MRNHRCQSAYVTRALASLAASLLLICLTLNLPLSFRGSKPFDPYTETFGFQIFLPTPTRQEIGVWGLTGINLPPATHQNNPRQNPFSESFSDEEEKPLELQDADLISNVDILPIHEFADEMPQIRGGLNSYYLNIKYPEEAEVLGIEGRLMMRFVVEPDGSTSNIEVLQSLHPLCDSAAVNALRHTAFIPGILNGRAERVRMQLPVKFMLVDTDSTLSPKWDNPP